MGREATSAVVLLSGGVDSSVLLHHVVRTLHCTPVYAMSFDYGQRHKKELACARWQAEAAGVAEHRILDVSFLGDAVRAATALVAGGEPVPDLAALPEDDRDQPPTYVPNRNMVLLSIAAAYAEARGVRDVFYGAQARDEYGYWDCTTAFVKNLNRVLGLNRRNAVTVHAPFVWMKKCDTVQTGLDLGVDFSHTWSCYRGGDTACGTCPTCVERLLAFREAGAPDPLPYA
ncbi:MAG: 7-cyano-7-deazaguanine synthase QueC [Candidatus Hydrogenedentes bacterium]|nr:7-cyano-7-deazaguanine synthase QueC [Candidatus Hydrogenedentota bacterium]